MGCRPWPCRSSHAYSSRSAHPQCCARRAEKNEDESGTVKKAVQHRTYQTASVRVAASRRVVVANAWGASLERLAVVGRAAASVARESGLAALALVALRVVLAVDTVSVLQVALRRVAVALAALAQTEVQSTTASRISRSAVLKEIIFEFSDLYSFTDLSSKTHFARCADISRWAAAHFNGVRAGQSAVTLIGVLHLHAEQRRRIGSVDVAHLDEERVKIGQGHEQVLAGRRLSVDSLPAVFEHSDLHGVLLVAAWWVTVDVVQSDVVALKFRAVVKHIVSVNESSERARTRRMTSGSLFGDPVPEKRNTYLM